ncbi:MAG: pyridoxal 5'-phosphate synthase glutaminase subunit PdxT [Candidatus Marinimicrobia bacterium]|nr:pyridoxal 5'-phosphate synthase glutaminase subunit PdxT [Candidatus Neomarinimicrobiota bacterium]
MIGVLALQGDYEKHIQILDLLKIQSMEIRYPSEMDKIQGLVIPGGESTTMTDLMGRNDFYQPIQKFAKDFPILGTCAGLIMMASSVPDSRVKPLGILDIEVDRNAYGRQIHSFTDQLPIKLDDSETHVPSTFIRAPKITNMSSNVEVISKYEGDPVAVRQGHHIGLSFHPELDNVTVFHDYIFKKQLWKKTSLKHHAA